MSRSLQILHLGCQNYSETVEAMRDYTANRTHNHPDKIIILEHTATYTVGHSTPDKHQVIAGIPVIKTDRGGQITYHGPGQLIIYPLIDLKQQHLSPHQMVNILEESVIDYLADLSLPAYGNPSARGVYIDEQKIASIGLRIKRFCSYHGLSINVLDSCLQPFDDIDTCGHPDLKVVSLQRYVSDINIDTVASHIVQKLVARISKANTYYSIQDQYYEQATRARQAIENTH
ncbi:MAG: lipoyl(octanoyl) transferase [Legionellales bacterium]|nr:lipoyl(octanoyl) transferase [Legionellales bacterium]|tara:strand:- start:915 stop:1607 length:693 start_codon:yes stop_codon:yes gene_type:complete